MNSRRKYNGRGAELGCDLVVSLDSVIGTLLASGVTERKTRTISLFLSRMRTYERLPKQIQRQIPTPWWLGGEQA